MLGRALARLLMSSWLTKFIIASSRFLLRALVYLVARAEVGGWSEFSISLSLRNPHQFHTKACTMVSSSTFAAKVARWLLFSVQLFLAPRDTKALASFFAGRLSKIAFEVALYRNGTRNIKQLDDNNDGVNYV